MASFWYTRAWIQIMKREATDAIDLDAGSVYKVMLVDDGYTASKDHDFVSDLNPGTNEIQASNYTGNFGGSGRKILTTTAINEDITNKRSVWDADDVTWTSLGGGTNDTIAWAVFFKENGGSDANSPLILQLDINPDVTTNGANFTIQFADSATQGIGYVQV